MQEKLPDDFSLWRLIVVASGCPLQVIEDVRKLERSDPRILLLEEPTRLGKIAAINTIRSHSTGEFLILVNSDAIPSKGSIATLLRTIASSPEIGSASALPTFRSGRGLTTRILDLMWSAHNTSSMELNHARLSNHNCDELMVVRSELMPRLPLDAVNDGAYIGGYIFSRGYHVVFSDQATVEIDVPSRVQDLIQQRRRILYGHAQVWKQLGRPPRTIESLMVSNPRLGVRLLAKLISSRPSLILVIPFAAVTESLAAVLSILDRLTSSRQHVVWRRYRR